MQALLIVLGVVTEAEAGPSPEFSLPVACKIGETCFVQNYVDVDPGRDVLDFMCGGATYQGHKGTDFRLKSAAATTETPVAVVAAAGGIVLRLRDGMPDILADDLNNKSLQGRDCGNGIVIDHGAGWETQYCHMRKTTVTARVGDKVKRGQNLGNIGYSGKAQFAHLHFAVRHKGTIIDPFSGRQQDGNCERGGKYLNTLWDKKTLNVLRYASGQVFGAGFTEAIPDLKTLELRHGLPKVTPNSRQLIFFSRLLNLQKGDQVQMSVFGPEGFRLENRSKPLLRHKATYVTYVGKRRTSTSWAVGHYVGQVQIIKGGAIIADRESKLFLRD